MTVKELIEILSRYPEGLVVMVQDGFCAAEDCDIDWYPPGQMWLDEDILHINGAIPRKHLIGDIP
jgi:hypothetical protein